LPHEPTPAETLASGADLVTFSGDKLLGGPQAGIIVGRADLVARIKRNPMKRALRCDKVTLAALSAVLRLYHDPDRLVQRLPTFRALARPLDALDDLAKRVAPALRAALVGIAEVEVIDCASQIGSGALPNNTVPSRGLAIRPLPAKRGAGAALKRVVKALSQLPTPVLGAVSNGALILDVRCLEEEDTFTAQLAGLTTKSL
jgi:L-seryl-tRNA(Ser) seleniumtransferase